MPRTAPPHPWSDLGDAERATFLELLRDGPLPRSELAERLDLSRPSLTRLTRTLLTAGLAEEVGMQLRTRTGRPSELLRIRPDAARLFGVKLTGDTAYAVVTDARLRVLAAHEEPLVDRDPEAVALAVADVERRLAPTHGQDGRFDAAAVTLAGDVVHTDAGAVVRNSVYLGWDEVAFGDLLEGRLRTGLVAVANDVSALTALMHWFGPAAGRSSMALITVGAGIGTGLVLNGQPYPGSRGRAGALEHLVLDPAGPICGHGHRGCVSVHLTNASIAASIHAESYAEVVRRARRGDGAARLAFEEAGTALGYLLAAVANAYDPEIVIVTGDGLAVMDLARTAVDRELAARRPLDPPPVLVEPLDFDAWARGGAVIALRALLALP